MKSLSTLKNPFEENRRFFVEQTKEYNLAIFGGSESVLGTFNDVDEDGRMDILLQTKLNGVNQILCIYNNYVKDAFFVKALMISNVVGVYGDATSGSSYRLIVTDLNDEKFVVIATQLSQSSAYLAL